MAVLQASAATRPSALAISWANVSSTSEVNASSRPARTTLGHNPDDPNTLRSFDCPADGSSALLRESRQHGPWLRMDEKRRAYYPPY
jgi:hypothetical protein